MANGNDGASVLIDVGVDVESSYTSFSGGIEKLIKEINKNPPKIRVELDLSHIKSSSIKSQLEQVLNGKGSGRGLTSTIDTSTLTKTAEGAKSASDEILRLKNETRSLNTTLNTASKRLSSLDAQLTKVRNPKTGETAISDTTKQLIDLQNKIKEINTTTKGITAQYFGLKTALGGEGATGDNAIDVERLKNKYLELMNAVELVRAKNATASAEEIQQVYVLQGEMDTLIAQIREKIATEEQEAAQRDKANSDEAEYTRLLKDAINLQNRYSAAINNSTKAEYSASSSQYYQNLKENLDYLKELSEAYKHADISAEEFSSETKTLSLRLNQNYGAIKANGDATKTFSERIGSLAEKFSYWFSITRVIMAVYRAMRQMVSASIELDDAMTQLKIVTKDTEGTYERFGDKIADTAKKIGSSISDLLDSTTVYARLGYSLDESSMLAEYTAMLQNVGNIDVSDAQDAITAIIKAFDVGVDDIESIMDKLVTTGNNFPISVAQIAEGMNNASSALAAAGNTFEQSVALLTAANTTIQNAAKSSTGLRTIAARIRNTKTELDDLGEEMSEASYEELVQQLTDFNVALTTTNGEYRSTYDIMYDIAQQWSKMTSMEQAALATAMSGTRQQAIFYSIIEQFQEATGAMDAMANSAGELQKSYDIVMESTTAHINQFKAAFQELGADTFSSDFLQQFIDLGTHVIELFDGLMKVVDALGGLNTVLYVTAGLLVTINANAIVNKLFGDKGILKGLFAPIKNLALGIKGLAAHTSTLSVANEGLATSLNITAVGADTATFSITALQLAVGALTAAIGIGIAIYSKAQKSLEETASKASEVAEESGKNAEAMVALNEQLKDGTKSTSELTEAFKDQLETMGYTETQIDDLIKKYHGLNGAIQGVTEEQLKQAAIDADVAKRSQFNAATGFGSGFAFYRRYLENIPYYESMFNNLKAAGDSDLAKDVDILKDLFKEVKNGNADAIVDFYNKLYDVYDLINNLGKEQDAGIFDTSSYAVLSQMVSKTETQFKDYIDSVNAADSSMSEYIKTWSSYQSFFEKLPTDAAELFAQSIYDVVDSSMTFGEAEKATETFANRLNELFNSDEISNIYKLVDGVREGTTSLFEYNQAVEKLGNGHLSFYGISEEIESNIIDFFKMLPEATRQTEALAQATEDWCAKYKDIPDMVESVDEWADVAAKAAEEMKKNGEISNETIKALAKLVGEGEDWLQYLVLENGELRLNIELLKERAMQDVSKRIESLQDELVLLEKQSNELSIQLALQRQLAELNQMTFEGEAKGLYDNPDLTLKTFAKVLHEIQRAQKEIEVLRNSGRDFDRKVQEGVDKAENKAEDENNEKEFDWIEVLIDRIQRKVNKFSRFVGSKFKALSTRNEASKKELEAITQEIELQEKAYERYIELCDSIDISGVVSEEEWAQITKKIREGAFDASLYDEKTAELITRYKDWYEAALDTKDAIDELHGSLASLYDDEFTRIQTDFENRVSLLEYLSNMYNTGISQLETEGYMASTAFYESLTEATEHNIELLKEELDSLEGALQAALDSGEIEMYSEAWYGYITTMNGVKEAIADANLSLAEFAKTMQEIDWEYFDYLQERISNITNESEFLLELLGEDNIFKDGKLTADGLSVLGLRAMDYNVYMAQADKYAQEIAEIERQIASDPNNRTLLDRREELLELQRESILAAEDEKDAILDLVQTAIEEELDSLKELIEAYKDALDAAKDLYDYRNRVSDETSEIASLQKQIFAYSGDNSEEARATIQQLKDQLIKAQKELEETEYDKYISDQKKLLDNLYAEYELLLNLRMDNIDALIADVIAMVNQNANLINETLHMTADSVGYTLSDSLQTIWGASFNSLQGVVTMYGEGFLSQLTTTNQALNNIASLVSNMQSFSNSWANSWIGGVNNSYVPDYTGWTPGGYGNNLETEYYDEPWETEDVFEEPIPNPTPAPTPTQQIRVGGMINAGDAPIYDYAGDTTGERQYFRNEPYYLVLDEKSGYLLTRWYKLTSGKTGWFKKSDVKAYKQGGLVDQTGLVWLDGTKQKPETVLNAEDTQRFQTLVESMDKFASKGFNMSDVGGASQLVGRMFDGGRSGIAPVRNSRLPIEQDVTITIPIDHVYDYDDFINQLKGDKNGKRILQALTLDEVLGKNSLGVRRYNA